MSRYIKFDDAVKIMACEMYAEAQSQGYDVDGIEDFMPEAKAWIADAPSIDIEPKRGEWIFKTVFPNDKSEFPMGYLVCSVCGSHHSNSTPCNYCDNCGARMKGADDE